MKYSKLYTTITAVFLALFVLSGSIAVPILVRPFYYAHIEPLALEAQTNLTREDIITAYDEMMDFCLGGDSFSTGVLSFSESGKAHFEDVRSLFLLDLRVLILSIAVLILLFVLGRIKQIRAARLLGRGPAFWAGSGLGALFLLTGGLAALDFDRAFVVFHHLFFPGKTNWLFDPAVDQIINILPEVFFRNCAILILGILIAGCAGLIIADLVNNRK